MTSLLVWIIIYVLMMAIVTAAINAADTMKSCGGILTENRGIIHTPQFPNKFNVPINCIWIIDASAIQKDNVSIVVYLTQQYVLSGLKFTEYLYYSDDYPALNTVHRKPFELNEDAVTEVSWLQFNSPFLMIEFSMTELHGTHLRALDQLLDVYGFNITYEMDDVKEYQCNTLKCRFMGHCYAKSDYSSYYCDCQPEFSGQDCGHGPMCHEDDSNFCLNGGICKHMGAITVNCLCPSGFKGEKCEIPQIEDLSGCNTGDTFCNSQCIAADFEQDICNCIPSLENSHRERKRYEATIYLGANSSTTFHKNNNNNNNNNNNDNNNNNNDNTNNNRGIGGGSDIKINENLPAFLDKHISRALRVYNITKISGSEIFNTISRNEIKFEFFSSSNSDIKIRDTIDRILMEKGRFGNFSASLLEFHQDIALNIESIAVKPSADIREDSEFELICTAKGSSNLIFRWYKDGVFVDLSRATRKIWEGIQDHKLYYENHLVVSKASKLDEGVYTCQISDFDVQLCRSMTIHVLSKLDLRIVPPSATVYRGESIRIRCISYGIHQRYGQLGFSWTKNGILFKSNSKFEMWEDLYPYGSILKISAIQKSANYTCISSTKVGQFSKSVYVYVVDRGSVELCPNNTIYNVKWPASSPGSPTLGDCPQKFSGQSKRICEQRDFGKPIWLTPDFSQCVSDHLLTIYNQFRELTFGYQKTNSSAVLNSCLEYAMNRQTHFLPGEAGFLLEVLQEINKYLQLKSIHSEQENAASVILRILDILMQSENSLNNQQQVKQLQALVQSSVLNREIITAPLPLPSTSLRNQQMHSFRIYKENIKMLPFNSQIYGDHLFSDQLYMEMRQTKTLEKITLDGNNIVFSVVSYKNLTNFLPRLYFERNSFAPDINYVLASRIITTTLYHTNHNQNVIEVKPLYLDMIEAHVEIVFQHENTQKTDWIPICGYDSQATFEVTWQTDRCITETIMENITKCNCPITGAFVVLQTKKNFNTSIIRNASRPIFVIVSCGLCFMQSCIAFTILLPVLYKRKCPVTFLKMQFCTSTSTAMAIFMLGLLKLLPQDWHGIISSSLAGVLLLGTSTLIGITLIIQSELGPRKNISSFSTSSSLTTTTPTTTPSTSSPNGLSSSSASALASGVRGAIALSWFLPLLYTISSPLVYTILGYWPFNWWLEYGYFSFIMFIIIELLYIILFILLFITVLGKLKFLAKKNDKCNTVIRKRIGLIYRTATLLTLKIIVDIFYLVYLNLNEFNCSYIFAVSSFLLGFFILICFVIKAEMKLNSEPTINKKITKHNMEDYCSGSINSPLSFYTNHEIERDNDSVPPSSMKTTKIPLTILTTSHCTLDHITNSKNNLDTFLSNETLSGGGGGGGTCISITEASFLDHHGNNNNNASYIGSGNGTESTTNYHCFELLGHRGPSQHEFYDNFQNESIKCYNGIDNHTNNNNSNNNNNNNINNNEYNGGVCTLDILKGVSKDSIIGIRSNLLENDSAVCKQITKHQNNNMSTIKQRSSSPITVTAAAAAATAIDKINLQHKHLITNVSHNKIHHPSISTSSSSSESSHKSVSLPNPKLYTPDQCNKQDTVIESSQLAAATAVQPSLPIITITSTDDENAMDGMLNRISDDLDYLLNRTNEIPSTTRRSNNNNNNNNNKQIEMEIISQSSTSSISSTISSSSNSSTSIPIISVGLNQQQQPVSHTGQLSSSSLSSQQQQLQQQPLLMVNTNSNCAFSIHDVILEECED